MFDCQRCQVADAVEALAPENAQAWRVFHRIADRFVVDSGVAGEVFRRATENASDTEYQELLERLSDIYSIVMPVKPSES